MKRIFLIGIFSLIAATISGCQTKTVNCSFNGLTTPDGTPAAHVHASNSAIHLFGDTPMIGDATLTSTFDDFTNEVKRLRCSKVRVVQSTYSRSWFFLPPISFIFVPSFSEVSGDVYR